MYRLRKSVRMHVCDQLCGALFHPCIFDNDTCTYVTTAWRGGRDVDTHTFASGERVIIESTDTLNFLCTTETSNYIENNNGSAKRNVSVSMTHRCHN